MKAIRQITKLSTRHLVLGTIGISALCALGILVASGWMLIYALQYAPKEEITGMVLSYGGIGLAAVAALIVLSSLGLNRSLTAREYDQRNLPDRPEFFDYELLNLRETPIARKSPICRIILRNSTSVICGR